MRCLLFVLLLPAALAACSRHDGSTEPARAPSAGSRPDSAGKQLAIEHAVQIDTDERGVAVLFEAGQAACRDDAIDLCTILESRIHTGPDADASLKFRAKRQGISKLISVLSRQAEIAEQSTTAEDVSGPIADVAKQQAMLEDYRSRLEALRSRANSDVDALIKLNRELAHVQSQLEAIAGQRAQLTQRVETEILQVAIRSDHKQSFWRPIELALSNFGTNLSQGMSIAISGLAFLIPWAFVLAFAAWLGRKLLRRRRVKEASSHSHQ